MNINKNFILLKTFFAILLNSLLCLVAHSQQWRTFNIINSGLPDNWINKLAIDKSNTKWFIDGMLNVVSFDTNQIWTVYDTTITGIQASPNYSIAIDKNQNVWIGSYSGLKKFDGTNWTTYSAANSCLGTEQINDLAIDSSNVIWLATNLGIIRFDQIGNSCTVFDYSGPYPIFDSPEIKVDKTNRVWTLSNDNMPWVELCTYDGIIWQNYSHTILGSSSTSGFSHLYCDTIGNLFGSSSNGIFKYDGTSFSIIVDSITSIQFMGTGAVLSSGNYIISSTLAFSGINFYDGLVWNFYGFSNSPFHGLAFDFATDGYGNFWIASDNGVFEFNKTGIVDNVSPIKSSKASKVFPSPCSKNCQIEFISEEMNSNVNFVLTNSVGEAQSIPWYLERSFSNSEIIKLDIENLVDGIYYFQIRSNKEVISGSFQVCK